MKKNKKKLIQQEFIKEEKIFKRRRKNKRRKKTGYHFLRNKRNFIVLIKSPLSAPKDFRFIEKSEDALFFFNKLRIKENCSIIRGQMIFRISLSKVELIDFATISILKCLFEEAKYYGIIIKSNLPRNSKCREFLVNSGFLNNMYDDKLKEIQIKSSGSHFSIEKKVGIVTIKDMESFDKISAESYQYLTGNPGFSDDVIKLLKEIGGNAVEWSNSYNNQWQIGVFFTEDKVIFNATDLGRGIRDSLYISNKLKMVDIFLIRDDLDILERAFDMKYGSLSQEINRNQGLPSIKKAHSDNKIANLFVCTNNVILNFGSNNSRMFDNFALNFDGTFYQWELNKSCLL